MLPLAAGTHTIQATYRAQRSGDFLLLLDGVATPFAFGHMTFSGVVRSTSIQIDVP
jgi:hypothetical protein